jgi:hypothetical protein
VSTEEQQQQHPNIDMDTMIAQAADKKKATIKRKSVASGPRSTKQRSKAAGDVSDLELDNSRGEID